MKKQKTLNEIHPRHPGNSSFDEKKDKKIKTTHLTAEAKGGGNGKRTGRDVAANAALSSLIGSVGVVNGAEVGGDGRDNTVALELQTREVGLTSVLGLDSRDIETRPGRVGAVGEVEFTPVTKNTAVRVAGNVLRSRDGDETTLGVGVDGDVRGATSGNGQAQGEGGGVEASEGVVRTALVPEDNLVVLGDAAAVQGDGVVVRRQGVLGDLDHVGAVWVAEVTAVGVAGADRVGLATEASRESSTSGGRASGSGGGRNGSAAGGDRGGSSDVVLLDSGRSNVVGSGSLSRASVGVLPGNGLAVDHGNNFVADSTSRVLVTALMAMGTGDSAAGGEGRQEKEGVLDLHVDVCCLLFLVYNLSKRGEAEREAAGDAGKI